MGKRRDMANLYPEKTQQGLLVAGMAKMPAGFLARICGLCDGAGRYEQRYTAGCGAGTYMSVGHCPCCEGYGLLVADAPASASVINQVLTAVPKHVLYEDSDENIPDAICDSNGQVVLGQCKVCSRAEIELEEHPACTPIEPGERQ